METWWVKNSSQSAGEGIGVGIGRICSGLKNQPHRFGGDFEKTLKLYCNIPTCANSGQKIPFSFSRIHKILTSVSSTMFHLEQPEITI